MKLFSRFGVLSLLALTAKFASASLQECSYEGGSGGSPNKCKLASSGTYLNTQDMYCISSNGGGLFYYTASGCTQNTNIKDGYYFFTADFQLVKSAGVSISNVVKCTGVNACTNYISSETRFYINAAADTFSGKLVSSVNGSYSSSEIAKSGSYYPAGTSSSNTAQIISCSGTSCEEEIITTSSYILSTRAGYIIKCTSTSCGSIPITSESYFQNSKATTTSNQLIYCNGSTCEALTASTGNYLDADSNKVIICSSGKCNLETSNLRNFYISTTPNVLIDCTSSSCVLYNAKIGVYLSAKDASLISCDATSCNELSTSEMSKVPICDVSSNKCVVKTTTQSIGATELPTLIPEGGYCLYNNNLYFATNTIELETSMITTTSSNCIAASSTYYQYYFTVGSTIYHIDDGEVSQITAPGYYFINTNTNKLVTGSKIEDYNYSYVKLYKCNGTSCVVISSPNSITYYVDVSKRIFKYSGNTFSFAYDKDVLCAYSNNKCVPNTDLKGTEFCVTSSGELVIAAVDIEAKKSGNCYKSSNISNEIFGYSSNLYKLNMYDATIIDTTGYYLVSINSNSTTEYKEFANKNTEIILYGCTLSSCSLKTPETQVYYYDLISHYLVKYDFSTSQWVYPTFDGYAFVSVEPGVNYIRKFAIDSTSSSRISLSAKVKNGNYYTVDNEMYECPNTDGSSCELIKESAYYMTNDNELYYCNVDDDKLSATICTKQSCILGELYFINGFHFRCVTGNIFNLLSTKYCIPEEQVIINFPTVFSDNYPANVKTAIDDISVHNNVTSVVKAGSNHLSVVPGIFTNCTYDKEEKTATFDLVCIENFVVVNDDKEPQVCSTTKLGFVGCSEDVENPDKCNPSSAMTKFLSKIAIAFAMLLFGFIIY